MAKRTPLSSSRPRRRKPRKKPQAVSFIDLVLDMLTSTTGMVMAGAGAVLLGRVLGEPVRGRIELPPGVPQEIVDEWGRLCNTGQLGREPEPNAEPDTPPAKTRRRSSTPRERPAAVELVKGEDGVYRPKE